MTAHAKLSASSSHRWTACPASVQAEAALPKTDEPASIHSLEGTAAHELAAICLTFSDLPSRWVGRALPESAWPVDKDMASYVESYIDFVQYHVTADAIVQYETRVSYEPWVPGGFGTADVMIIDGDTMHIIDLKYGRGVKVSPLQNTQLILYALGAHHEYGFLGDIKIVKMTIHQPRVDDGEPQTWEITLNELLRWGEWIRERALLCFEAEPEYVPGEKQCRWCAASPTCAALAKHVSDIILLDFDNIDSPEALPAPRLMTDDQLASALSARRFIVSWLNDIERHAIERIESGEGFPGYKLVAGRSIRKWADEAQAETALVELLAEVAHTRSLISPAQAEKALGKKRAKEIQDLIIKPEGAPTLVPQDDPREAINTASADDFD